LNQAYSNFFEDLSHSETPIGANQIPFSEKILEVLIGEIQLCDVVAIISSKPSRKRGQESQGRTQKSTKRKKAKEEGKRQRQRQKAKAEGKGKSKGKLKV